MREPITRRHFLKGAAAVAGTAVVLGGCEPECNRDEAHGGGSAGGSADGGAAGGTSQGDPSNFAGAATGAFTQLYVDGVGAPFSESEATAVWSRGSTSARIELRPEAVVIEVPARPTLEVAIDEFDFGQAPAVVREHFGGVALEELRRELLSLQLGV